MFTGMATVVFELSEADDPEFKGSYMCNVTNVIYDPLKSSTRVIAAFNAVRHVNV